MHSLKHGCVHQLNLRMRRPANTTHRSILASLGRMVLAAAITTVLLAFSVPVTTARDVEQPEQLLSVDIEVGTSVTFHLNVPWSAPPPTAVSVLFGLPNSNVNHRGAADFAVQKRHLSASYEWQPRGSIVPGVEIQYAFEIASLTGTSRTDPVTFTYIDRTLDWNIVTEGSVELWLQSPRAGLTSEARTAVIKALSALKTDLNLAPNRPIRIVLYTDGDRMRADLGGGTREWVGGVAVADLNVILLYAGLPGLTEAIAHELTHIVIDHATENPFGRVPSWLHEGLATVIETRVGVNSPPYNEIMAAIATCDQFVSLRGLTGSFPASDARAIAAYAQSHSLVTFVIDRWGKPAIREILDAYSTGITDDQAIQQVLGLSLDDLEAAWIQNLAVIPSTSAPSPNPIVATVTWAGGVNVRTHPCPNGVVAYVAPDRTSITLSGETKKVFGVTWLRVSDGNWVDETRLVFPGPVRTSSPPAPVITAVTPDPALAEKTQPPQDPTELPDQHEIVRSIVIAAALLLIFVAAVIGVDIRQRR